MSIEQILLSISISAAVTSILLGVYYGCYELGKWLAKKEYQKKLKELDKIDE